MVEMDVTAEKGDFLHRRLKLLGVAGFASILLGSVIPAATGVSAGQMNSSSTVVSQFGAERQALVASLQRDPGGTSLAKTEQLVGSVQTNLVTAQGQLASLNTTLAKIAQEESANQATLTQDDGVLAPLLRDAYETSPTNNSLIALLDSGSFTQALAVAKSQEQINSALEQSIESLVGHQTALTKEKASVLQKLAAAKTLENTLNTDQSQLMAAVTEQNDILSTATPQEISTVATITTLDNQAAQKTLGGTPGGPASGSPSVGSGPCGNHFDFGECTWYVASQRCIPWFGNADQWFSAAQADGYSVGQVPVRGAVVVFWPGGDGAGSVGHVAYVEGVGPAPGLPAGHFLISEMNFYINGGGWDRVDYRLLTTGDPGIQGFIYNS